MSGPGRAVVIGAGVGGLAAALRLRQLGHPVTVLEGRDVTGGLASAVHVDGHVFDGGPYILLDRPGLEWAFARLGMDMATVPLRRLDHVYAVETEEGTLDVHHDLQRTANGFDARWPGAGEAYARFVHAASDAYDRLAPALRVDRPGARELLAARGRAWGYIFRSLAAILRSSRLPAPVADALAIWTRIAGHPPDEAPGFMALVPALIHRAGAFTAPGGLAGIPDALAGASRAAGVDVRLGARVRAIHHDQGEVRAVELEDGERLEAPLVVSNVGLSTYIALLSPRIDAAARPLERLPLQSPGMCAYLVARGTRPPAYLRFRRDGESTRVLVAPRGDDGTGDLALRLITPIAHETATRLGPGGQEERLDALVAEPWWRAGLTDVRVVARRVPATWGRSFGLYRDAMNPVMTPGLARRGRLAHRSPWLRGLYLAGSATHPGQWVSFCCISGVLAAERAHADAC